MNISLTRLFDLLPHRHGLLHHLDFLDFLLDLNLFWSAHLDLNDFWLCFLHIVGRHKAVLATRAPNMPPVIVRFFQQEQKLSMNNFVSY